MRPHPGLLAAALAVAAAAHAEPQTYLLDAEKSAVTIEVGKSGLFSAFGHRHEVVAQRFSGTVRADPGDLAASAVEVVFEAAALKVSGQGEPPDDVPKVQEAMAGPKVLDVSRFPQVAFRSRSVSGREARPGVYEVTVDGEMTLHGVTRPLQLPMHVEITGDTLTATGRTTLRQKDFGITPVSVGGVVNVKNELGIAYRLVGHLQR